LRGLNVDDIKNSHLDPVLTVNRDLECDLIVLVNESSLGIGFRENAPDHPLIEHGNVRIDYDRFSCPGILCVEGTLKAEVNIKAIHHNVEHIVYPLNTEGRFHIKEVD